jgi:hypothetical protein
MSTGPRCRRCQQSEAACALAGGDCCPTCTHWSDLDDYGNDKRSATLGQMRPTGSICGTEVGFAWHVQRGTAACYRCRHAWRQAKIQRLAASA